jgi:tRNA/tmRNA/rRNA uracil-C5-methylase (TrmA/RlmC/RlmD family)
MGVARRTEVFQADRSAIGARGEAVARDGRRTVFLTGALPGERVVAAVLGERPTYLRARAVEILEPSPLRVVPACPELARGCGGCQWQHVSLAGQRALKEQAVTAALRRPGAIAHPPAPRTVELPAAGYRTSLRAAVAGGRAGYRRARGHQVVPVSSCLVVHPLLEELLVDGRYGEAEEVILRCGARTGDRLAVPVPGGAEIAVPAGVRGDHVHELVAGRRWRISTRSFFQARPDGADALTELVAAAAGAPAPGGGRAVDLYSGVGLFAGVLAGQGWEVTAVESSGEAVADAAVNLAGEPVDVVCADVASWRSAPAELTVADPARSGLGPGGVAAVTATGARRVILVSCDAQALGRDTAALRRGGYRLSSVTLVDLFPETFHLEAVSVFER